MNVVENERNTGKQERTQHNHPAHAHLVRLLERLSCLDLPAKDHFENYLHYKVRSHHKTRTMNSSFGSIIHFLSFYGNLGKREIKEVERSDLEAFIEHEQDRGMHISTIKTRLACIVAFLHYLIEQDLIPNTAVRKRIRVKLPETLPRAMNPQDAKKLLSFIDHTQDRALFLLLLRTGIRIGETLALTMNDVDLKDRKVHVFQGEKNDMGRVVYMSNDAVFCLKRWFRWRDPEKVLVFYGKGDAPLSYSTARIHFTKYVEEAGLAGKGYTVHCLRHTDP